MTKTERWKGLILVFIIVYFTSGLLKNESSMTKRTDEDMAEIKTMNPSYQEDLEEKELGTLMDTLNGLNLQDFLEPKQNISNIIHSLNNKKTKPTTLEELNIFSNLLLNQQEVGEGRSFGCSSDIKQKFARCLGKCKDISCNIKELQNFLSACRSGTKKLCIGESESTLESIYKCEICGLANTAIARRKGRSNGKRPNRKRPNPNRKRPNRKRPNPNRKKPNRKRPNRKRPSKITRVLGGVEVIPPRKYPWQVLVLSRVEQNNTKIFLPRCGGSIINSRWILTAGQCLNPMVEFRVRVGEHNLTNDNDRAKEYSVGRQVLHPEFGLNLLIFNNNFGLLELTTDIEFVDNIRPVCLPEDDSKNYEGEKATFTGWGNLDYDFDFDTDSAYALHDVLLEAEITIDANADCNKTLNAIEYPPIYENHLCARAVITPTEYKGPCYGDDGGPLVVKEGDRYIQVGIVSSEIFEFLFPFCLPRFPNIYSRVSKELNWIRKTTASGTC